VRYPLRTSCRWNDTASCTSTFFQPPPVLQVLNYLFSPIPLTPCASAVCLWKHFVPMPLQRSCSDSIRLQNSAFTLPSVLMLKLCPSFWCRKISHCNKEVIMFRFSFSRPQIFLCPCPSPSSSSPVLLNQPHRFDFLHVSGGGNCLTKQRLRHSAAEV